MAYENLRKFIDALEHKKLLKRITVEVDPYLEISEITDRVTKKGGPALLFEKVKGSPMPVLINAFGTMERMCLALETPSLDDIADRVRELVKPKAPSGLWEKIAMLPKLHEMSKFIPKKVKSAPCQEVVIQDGPMLSQVPVLTCWPKDGGPFITLPLVCTKDPETGERNVGMYRMHVYDNTETAMHWQLHKHGKAHWEKYRRLGKRMEVAVALGADPATIYAATAPMPDGMDEFMFSGFLRREPVELVKAKTVDVEVPASAEIILEGYVDPEDLRVEGPFGDHTGFYSPADLYPTFHLTAMTMRKNPIYSTTIVGKPIQEDYFLGKATERIFLPMLQMVVPEIIDMNFPPEGVFHNAVIVSIKKSYPGQAKKIMNALWGMGQMMFTRMIIVVDAGINVHDLSEVAWVVTNNMDPKRDFLFTEGPVDVLTHSVSHEAYGSKVGIDATVKGQAEGMARPWPEVIAMAPDMVEKVASRWKEYKI